MGDRSPSWPLVLGVLVEPKVAPQLLALLVDGRRRASRDGWRLPPEVQGMLTALDRLAAQVGQVPAEPQERVWISTEEASEVMGVSTRRIVQLLNERKLEGRKTVGGRWQVDATDVWFRASEGVGTPSASADEPFCA